MKKIITVIVLIVIILVSGIYLILNGLSVQNNTTAYNTPKQELVKNNVIKDNSVFETATIGIVSGGFVGSEQNGTTSNNNNESATLNMKEDNTSSALAVSSLDAVRAANTAKNTSYTFTVDYSKSLADSLAAANLNNVDPNIIAGLFPITSGSGTKTITAKLVTPSDIYASSSKKFTTCDVYLVDVKAAGYHPLTLQEGLALIAQYPRSTMGNSEGGMFLGTVAKTLNDIGKKSYFSSVSLPYYLAGKYLVPNYSSNGLSLSGCAGSFFGVKDSTFSDTVIQSINTLPIYSGSTASKAIVFPKNYSVSVNYDSISGTGFTNTPNISGTKTVNVQIAHIYGGGSKNASPTKNPYGKNPIPASEFQGSPILWLSQDQIKSIISSQLPGYRPALASEMKSLNEQYPSAHGKSYMMAFGTWSAKCGDYPWISAAGKFIDKILGDTGSIYANIGGIESNHSITDYPITSKIRVFPADSWVFPVVKI